MPRLNGLDLLCVLKEAELDIPVGLVTAEHTVEKRREAKLLAEVYHRQTFYRS